MAFHLSLAVNDLQVSKDFYCSLGCEIGREKDKWLDIHFFGHQVTLFHSQDRQVQPIDHFGVILNKRDWLALLDKVKALGLTIALAPKYHKPGERDEKAKFMLQDPDGNLLEFKYYLAPYQTLVKDYLAPQSAMDEVEILTPRLRLRPMRDEDAAFIFDLVNQPDFIANIGDKQVRNLQGALEYIQSGPQANYEKHGFGLYLTELKHSREPIGMCGLLQRDNLDAPDIGYAIAAEHQGKGYAGEAAKAALSYATNFQGVSQVLGVISPGNEASGKVLEKAGLKFAKSMDWRDGNTALLYALTPLN